jgi:hypothetical protein
VIDADSSLTDIAFAVCTALDAAGIVAVLTGGGAAHFYAPQQYLSYDLDFIIQIEAKGSSGRATLNALGFELQGEHYAHPRTKYILEFPAGPLGMGDDLVNSWETVRRGDEVLRVLSRTDSARDRLAAYYHWGDAASLFTAVDVGRSGAIDLDVIEQWSKRERNTEKFGRFLAQLNE